MRNPSINTAVTTHAARRRRVAVCVALALIALRPPWMPWPSRTRIADGWFIVHVDRAPAAVSHTHTHTHTRTNASLDRDNDLIGRLSAYATNKNSTHTLRLHLAPLYNRSTILSMVSTVLAVKFLPREPRAAALPPCRTRRWGPRGHLGIGSGSTSLSAPAPANSSRSTRDHPSLPSLPPSPPPPPPPPPPPESAARSCAWRRATLDTEDIVDDSPPDSSEAAMCQVTVLAHGNLPLIDGNLPFFWGEGRTLTPKKRQKKRQKRQILPRRPK